MDFQIRTFGFTVTATAFLIAGCAGKTKDARVAQALAVTATESDVPTKARHNENGPLICKARKSKFRFDWEAASPNSADGRIDQNSVSYDFRAADRPAGASGENLKVGECGWAAAPMTNSKKEKSSLSYKRLSDEATETFYKLRTGKVFSVPVRQGKNGVTAIPGAAVTIVR